MTFDPSWLRRTATSPRRTEVASGLAGSAVARQEGANDSVRRYGGYVQPIDYSTGLRPDQTLTDPLARSYAPATREELLDAFNFGDVNFNPNQSPLGGVRPGFGQVGLPTYGVPPTPPVTPGGGTTPTPSPSPPGVPDGTNQSNVFERTYQNYIDEQLAFREAVKTGIEADYNERIAQLQDELDKYKGGLAGVNKAYNDYADDADAILGDAAQVEADPLDPSVVPETVQRSYDQFEGQMGEMLAKIDTSGNPHLAQEMAGQVTDFEQVALDSLRANLADQDALHQAASAQAQAIAHMAWKDDLYNAERSRVEMEMNIQSQIDAKADEIEATRDAMNRAIADAVSGIEIGRLAPDELWDRAFNQMLTEKGFNEAEIAELSGIWGDVLSSNPNATGSYVDFKNGINQEMNYELLENMGFLPSVTNVANQFQTIIDDDSLEDEARQAAQLALDELNRLMSGNMTADTMMSLASVTGLDSLARAASQSGFQDSLDTVTRRYDPLMDLWDYHRTFVEDYEKHLSEQALKVPVKQGGQAPNNWQNRFTPEYTYRREVVAPHFAQVIKQTFPNYGIRIGGLGYMRPPNHVGGGKAANSDHQSGGAIDVYANNKQQLYEIERWARSQPGISLVVHSGDKHHEGHHVHISFQVGYQV